MRSFRAVPEVKDRLDSGVAPLAASPGAQTLSPWWRRVSLITMAFGFAVLILLTFKVYHEGPPIPDRVLGPDGTTVFTGEDVLDGQQVFLKHGLMDNGSIWGHGALLGPDFSAEYRHTLSVYSASHVARLRHGRPLDGLTRRSAPPSKRKCA